MLRGSGVHTRWTDEFEQGYSVVDDRGQRSSGAVRGRERPQFLSHCRADAHGFLRDVTEGDQRRAQAVCLVLRVADQVAGLGQGGDDAQTGRLALAGSSGEFGDAEPVVRVSRQKVEHLDDALRRR
jgi:hypothetical protein